MRYCTDGAHTGHVAVRFEDMLNLIKGTPGGEDIKPKQLTTAFSAVGTFVHQRWGGDQKKKLSLNQKPDIAQLMEGGVFSMSKMLDYAYEVISTVPISSSQKKKVDGTRKRKVQAMSPTSPRTCDAGPSRFQAAAEDYAEESESTPTVAEVVAPATAAAAAESALATAVTPAAAQGGVMAPPITLANPMAAIACGAEVPAGATSFTDNASAGKKHNYCVCGMWI